MNVEPPDNERTQQAPSRSSSSTSSPSTVPPDGPRRPEMPSPPHPSRWLRAPWSWVWLGSLVLVMLGSAWLALFQAPHPNPLRDVGEWDVGRGDWWLYPLEFNAARRTVINGELHAVHALPGTRKLWAVGEGGLILHSDDAGATWVQQGMADTGEPGQISWLPIRSAHAAEQAKKAAVPPVQQQQVQTPIQQTVLEGKGSAVGTGSATLPVQQTATPALPAVPPPAPIAPERLTLRSVYFADAQRGWAAGDAGRIIATADGGVSWRSQSSGSSNDLNAIRVFSDGRGWAVGNAGTVLSTRDGGASWQAANVGVSRDLRVIVGTPDGAGVWIGGDGILLGSQGGQLQILSDAIMRGLRGLAFSADGRQAWAVGDAGRTQTSSDGGARWNEQEPVRMTATTASGAVSSLPTLRAVAVAADGGTVSVVGDSATLMTWHVGTGSRRAVGTSSARLNAISFADATHGWAVGAAGTVLATRDGGESWCAQSSTPGIYSAGPYSRHGSPLSLYLFFVAAVLMLLLIALARFKPEQDRTQPAADHGLGLNSDQPAQQLVDDRLGHADTVIALSEFIRNADTDPRLTIAITAPWGRGKSSIMRMLEHDLRAKGFRSAWFNAWHHQQEGRPLSALFNAIRSQALPSGVGGFIPRLRVRLKLNWQRGWLYRMAALLMLGVMVFVLADIVKSNDSVGTFLARLEWRFSHAVLNEPHVVLSPAALASVDPFRARDKQPASCNACDPACADQAAASELRPAVFCYMQRALAWQPDNQTRFCADRQGNCEFDSREILLKHIEAGTKLQLYPTERDTIAKAAEALPPPGLVPLVEKLLAVLLPVLALIIGKGITIYGLEILKPLRGVLGQAATSGEGKESTGTVEKYRVEFCQLAEALSGRLVIFIDDLDRCNESTVNSLLEMTNYLVDVGKCFIVIGADLTHVKACIKAPADVVGDEARKEYANRYLRKLVHIEVPVPGSREDSVRKLFGEATPPAPQNAKSMLRGMSLGIARTAWPIQLMLLLVCAVIYGALQLADIRRSDVQPIAMVPPGALMPGAVVGGSATAPVASPAATVGEVGLHSSVGSPYLSISLILAGLILALAVGARLRGSRQLQDQITLGLGGAIRSIDSADFRAALELWHPLVFEKDGTPRGSKRFRNKARFFGTLLAREFGERFDPELMRVHAVALVALNFTTTPDGMRAVLAREITRYLVERREDESREARDAANSASRLYRDHQDHWGSAPDGLVESFIAHARAIEVR